MCVCVCVCVCVGGGGEVVVVIKSAYPCVFVSAPGSNELDAINSLVLVSSEGPPPCPPQLFLQRCSTGPLLRSGFSEVGPELENMLWELWGLALIQLTALAGC